MQAISIRSTVLLLLLAFAACGGRRDIYQGMDAEALFRLAQQEVAEGEHDNAIRTLDRLILAYGDWNRLPEARMLLADTYRDKEEYLTAAAEYRRFLDRYPGHAGAPDAALGRCRALAQMAPRPERDQTYTQQALTECSNTAIDFQGTAQASEASLLASEMRENLARKDYLNGNFYLRREMYDSAIKYFEFVIRRYPDTSVAPQALLGIYRANSAIGYDDLAEDAREQLLARYPESPAAEELRTGGDRG